MPRSTTEIGSSLPEARAQQSRNAHKGNSDKGYSLSDFVDDSARAE